MRKCPQCGSHYQDDVTYCNKDGTQLSNMDAVPEAGGGTGVRQPGTVLGSYRLVQLIGEGGMGRVYLAQHTRLGRKVALKVLRSEYSSNPSAIRRFFGEARAVNQINHENIVEITDFIEEEGGENYYIMEFLKGQGLADVMIHEGVLSVPRALGIAIQVCGTLAAVHGAGIIHRDLKPDNIFLTEQGGRVDFVKLLDFGVAKLVDTGDGKALHQTDIGAILGTPEYMSPEQASGKMIDYRTDIYALGVILYEMLTGIKPLKAKSYGEMVIKLLTVVPSRPNKLKNLPASIPRDLENVIMQCLEKEPEKRPQSMKEIEVRLRSIGEAASAQLESFSLGPQRKTRRAGLIAAGAGLAVVAGALLGLVIMKGPDRRAAAADKATGSRQSAEKARSDLKPADKDEVEISFDSTPRGAQVFLEGSQEPLGLTPLSYKVKRSGQAESFEFKLAGHKPLRQEVPLRESSRVVVTLLKAAKPKRKRKRVSTKPGRKPRKPALKGSSQPDYGATIDPFAE